MPITVALVQAPGLLGDVLESVISKDPAFILVARVEAQDRLSAAAERLDAVVVGSPDGSISGEAARLLDYASVAVAVSADGKRASVRGRGGDTAVLQDPSPQQLLHTIRARAGGSGRSARA